MSINSSSTSDPLPLRASLIDTMSMCFQYRSTSISFTSFSVVNIFLLFPLYTFVLHLGLQRWRTRRSASNSHSDVFTYHMVAIETVGIVGCVCYCCGAFARGLEAMMIGVYLFSVTLTGQVFIHIPTCVERHLAVVHPITYASLRNRGGLRIRNATIGCAWLLYLGSYGPMYLGLDFIIHQTFLLSTLSIVVVSFCSLSVLCTLIRPGPGTPVTTQVKMRAFHTIVAIWGALLLRFGGHVLVTSIFSLPLSESIRCSVLVSGVWFCLPSSLVLPLLFLHRAGKLMCGKVKHQDGPRVRVDKPRNGSKSQASLYLDDSDPSTETEKKA